MLVKFIQDVDKAIIVMRDASRWLKKSGKKVSQWWQLNNLNRQFLFQYAKPDEFYVGLIGGQPAVAAILQINQKAQDWEFVDKDKPKPALYIHWLCVQRDFSGKNLPKSLVAFAVQLALNRKVKWLRVDCDADETNLRRVYEQLGFILVAVIKEDYRNTAFYQKPASPHDQENKRVK